jgi:hypothetical protein
MEENKITAKSRQSVAEIIPPPNMHQFVPKNADELWSLQSRKELVGQQDFGVSPPSSGRRAEARDEP